MAMRSPDVLAQVRRTVAVHRLLPSRARVVVAVSGGADSVALLHVLLTLRNAWKLTLHVAHLDHGLRQGSGDDAAFVRTLAERWELPATIERRDVGGVSRAQGWSVEDGARRVRYQFLLEVAKTQSAGRIALAHTADDQAETVLMRLMRGTGLWGLGAIPLMRPLDDAQDVWVVRPLLEVWRRDLLAYLTHERLTYREDPTNQDVQFVRNRVRHHLLPLLERDYNPNVKAALTQLAEQCRGDAAYLQSAAARQWRRVAKTSPLAQVAMTVTRFLRQPKALQRHLVRRAIQQVRGDLGQFEFRHWLEAERLFTERPVGSVLDLPGGVQLRRERTRVVCQCVSRTPQPALLD